MTSLNILSGGAAQGLVASLAQKFKHLTGFDIAGEFADRSENGGRKLG
jgi:molybdate transport system substrate-binding protein